MRHPIPLLAALLLAASPAAALSVSEAACDDHTARLVGDDWGWRLTVNGDEVPLEPGYDYEGPICVSRDGDTLFGLTQLSVEQDERHFVLDPATRELEQITYEEAEALEFWHDEDDWELDLGD